MIQRCRRRIQAGLRFYSNESSGPADEDLRKLLDEQPHLQIPSSTYGAFIRKFAAARALEQGKKLHAHIAHNGRLHDRLLANLLVFFYGKCGEVEEAFNIFKQISLPNLFSWTVIITALAQNGHSLRALHCFQLMDLEGVRPDSFALSAALEACADELKLEQGRIIHKLVASEGIESDSMLLNTLLNMYSKCGSLDEAKLVFAGMPEKNLISWSIIISAHAQEDQGREAIRLWKQMQLEGFKPDKVNFVTFVDACANSAALDEGKLAHEQIISQAFDRDRIVSNTLVNLYSKCGKLETAREIFERIVSRDDVSWNSMIAGYVLHSRAAEAFHLFRLMDMEGMEPTKVTFVIAFDSCSERSQVKLLQEFIAEIGLEVDEVIARAILNAYRSCGSFKDLKRSFEEFRYSSGASSLVWNGVLACFSELGSYSFSIFRRMQLEGVKSDKLTMISLLDACINFSALREGKLVHSCARELGLDQNMFVQTALVNMYGKCGRLQEAKALFDNMKIKDSITWNSMLSSYVQNELTKEAIQLFLIMDLEGVKMNILIVARVLDACGTAETLLLARALHSEATGYIDNSSVMSDIINLENSLLTVYSRCRLLQEAESLFRSMKLRNEVSFNTMMAAYSQHGSDKECLETFHRMQLEGFKPDNISYVSVLDACTNLSALAPGKAIHSSMLTSGIQPDVISETALLNMYGKCGSLEIAWELFETMKNQRDFVCWNTVIAAYAQHGRGESTLKLFRMMQQDGFRPDNVSVLVTMAACSHAGLLDEALELFVSMIPEYELSPAAAHFGCMIDMLGRSSRLSEAEEFIQKLPGDMDCATWKIFLSSCKEQGDDRRGARAAHKAIEFQPLDSMPYLLLANMHAQKS